MSLRLLLISMLIVFCIQLSFPQCGSCTLCITDLQWEYPVQHIYYHTNFSIPADWATAIVQAADVWNNESSGIDGYSFITPSNNTSNYIDVSSTQMGSIDCSNFTGELAYTVTVPQSNDNTIISYAYTIFNTDPSVHWTTSGNPNSGQVDVESIMIHEFGLWLPLNESTDQSSIMYQNWYQCGAAYSAITPDV